MERQAELKFTVEYKQEEDGRWLAEVKELPGVLTYGTDPDDAVAHAQALVLRVIADRLENGEDAP
jgi:predicted RNase H-like HicB family nuclease